MDLKTISSVLASGKACSSWAIEQDAMVPDSLQIQMFQVFLLGNRRSVSSAKLCRTNFEKTLCKSLIYTKNNKGPSVCGTPYKTFCSSEDYPLICTCCFQFVRLWDHYQLFTCPMTLQCSNFARRMWWLTVSNNFCRLMKMPHAK